jgi:hypothetical protein
MFAWQSHSVPSRALKSASERSVAAAASAARQARRWSSMRVIDEDYCAAGSHTVRRNLPGIFDGCREIFRR